MTPAELEEIRARVDERKEESRWFDHDIRTLLAAYDQMKQPCSCGRIHFDDDGKYCRECGHPVKEAT